MAELVFVLKGKDELSPVVGGAKQNLFDFGQVLNVGIGTALGGALVGGLSLAKDAIFGLAEGAIAGNAEFERYNTQFGVLLGSAEAAKTRLSELTTFSASTPFELPQVVQADKILTGFGLTSDEAAKRFGFNAAQIRTIAGDVAAGTGASFQDMALLLGKFSSGATGEAISRFQEMGIVTREQLTGMGLEFSKSGELLSPLPEAMAKVLGAMEDKFGGMMKAQSGTFEGMLSNLEDWKGNTIRTLGEPIFDVVKGHLGGLLTYLGSPEVQTGLGKVGEFLGWAVQTGINAAQALTGFIQQNWPIIQATTETAFGAARQVMESVSGFVNTVLLPAIQDIAGQTGIQIPNAQQVFETGMRVIGTGIQMVAGFITTILIPTLTVAVQWVQANWPTIQAVTTTVFNAVMGIADFFRGNIEKTIKLLTLAVNGDWYQLGQEMRKNWDELWKNVQLLATNAIDWFKNVDWGAVGMGIIQGIATGITAATHFIVSAAQNAAAAALAAAKGFLGISSPSSRFFEEVGVPSMQGWSNAILANASLPARATAYAAGQSVAAARHQYNYYTMNINTPTAPNVPSEFYRASAAAGAF
jgi:hypothetical protein